MIRPLVTDPVFLAGKSVPAGKQDGAVLQDLKDTLLAHREGCAGMAANMIGEKKCVIVFFDGFGIPRVMCNPVLKRGEEPYLTQEGCLSLSGVRSVRRFRRITLRWQDEQFRWQAGSFEGFTAEVIQHELDHTKGILI